MDFPVLNSKDKKTEGIFVHLSKGIERLNLYSDPRKPKSTVQAAFSKGGVKSKIGIRNAASRKERSGYTVQAAASKEGRARSVSYTHLDVYKRQVLNHGLK